MPYESKFSLILIDDDLQMSEMLKDFFQEKYPNASVSNYSSGEAALSTITTGPGLFILDYHLDGGTPGAMNGIQVLKRLREKYPDSPVVFLSGQERAEVSTNTTRYGAFDYVIKDEKAFEKLETIINVIIGQRKEKSGNSKNGSSSYLWIVIVLALLILAGIFFLR